MSKKEKNSELETYKKHVQKELNKLIPILSKAAIGDFSQDLKITEEENEFSQLQVGIQVILDVVRDKISEYEELNNNLQRKVQERTNSLREAQYLAHIGSWEWEISENIIHWSNEMYRIFGLEPQSEEIDYEKYLSFVHPEDNQLVRDTIEGAYQSGNSFNFFHKIKRSDGTVRMIQCRGRIINNESGKPVKMLGTGQDVTELKEVEEQLLKAKSKLESKVESRTTELKSTLSRLEEEVDVRKEIQEKAEELAAIVENTHDAIIGKTLKGTITSWNKAAQRLYGYSAKEAIGQHISLIIPEEKNDELKDIMKNLNSGKHIKHFKTRRVRKDGKSVYVHLTISPIKNELGKVTGASSVAKDISDQVAAQEELKEIRQRLSNFMNKAKDIFMIFDNDLKLLEINRSGLKALNEKGKKKQLDKSVDELLNLPGRKSIKKLCRDVINKEKGVTIEDLQFLPQTNGNIYHSDFFKMPEGIGLIARDVTEEQVKSQELNESERKYRTLVETMNEGLLVVNNKDVIQFANETFCKMMGYSEKELMGKKAMNMLLPKGGKKRMRKVIKERQEGKSNQYEIRMKTKKGKFIWMLVNGAPVYDDGGKVIGSVGIHSNITQRKQYEANLDALAKFPAENPNPVMRFSIHGQVLIFVNKAAKHFVKHFESDKKLRRKWINLINEVYEKGEVVKEELDLEDKTYLFALVPVKDGKYINLYGTDITAEREAEKEIRRLLFVLSQTDNAILIADNHGRIQWVNDAFQKITGYSFEEVKGTHGEQLRHGKKTGLDTNHPIYERMIKTKESVSYETKNYTKEGKEYWSLTTLTPVLDKEGDIEGIVAVDADVTDKKKAEKAIIHAKKLAEESSKSKEIFLANVSHEIRTPMNAIMGIIQLLQETKLDKQQKDYLKSINFAGENLLRIINDVLDLSKVESGKMSVENIKFNIREMLNDLINSISHNASDKKISLDLKVDKNVPKHCKGDPVRINQILINLVNNAIKFTDKGGVSVEVKKIKETKKKEIIQFNVKDSGIGIAPEQQKQIFREFEQAHKETTRKYGGTGLGLSIVQKFTRLLNGELNLESKPKKGSTFSIELPLEKASKDENIAFSPVDIKDEGQLKGKNILLVEDNKLNQMVANRFLIGMGMNVDVVGNGKKAVKAVKEKEYDAVLMDIRMPEMDGYQATEKIRQNMKNKIPIMAMTAHALKKEEKKCYEVGMNAYITKPLKKDLLFDKLLELMNGHDD